MKARGGEVIFAVGFTLGRAPFGPCVEIVDGELRLPDGRVDVDTKR